MLDYQHLPRRPAAKPSPRTSQRYCRNRVLARLREEDFASLAGHLRTVRLERGRTLLEAGMPVEHVWFPHDCVVSVLTVLGSGACAVNGVIGPEGLVGYFSAMANGDSIAHGIVHVAGTASMMERARFLEAFDRSPDLRRTCLSYAGAFLAQVMQAAPCNMHHSVEARLARWLLTLHDRLGHDRLPVTHDATAAMLGANRSTVSQSAQLFHSRRLIEQRRGAIYVRDRAGLAAVACECYGVVQERIDQLLW